MYLNISQNVSINTVFLKHQLDVIDNPIMYWRSLSYGVFDSQCLEITNATPSVLFLDL